MFCAKYKGLAVVVFVFLQSLPCFKTNGFLSRLLSLSTAYDPFLCFGFVGAPLVYEGILE